MRPAIADDDPFAELTRIMGFDPREPVRPVVTVAMSPLPAEAQVEHAAPEPSSLASTPLPSVEPDFSIDLDLERELMGEFGDDAPYARDDQAPAVSAAPVPPSRMEQVDAISADEAVVPAGPAEAWPTSPFVRAEEPFGLDRPVTPSPAAADSIADEPAAPAAELDIEDQFFLALDGHPASQPQAQAGIDRFGAVERDPVADDVVARAATNPGQSASESVEPIPDVLPSYDEMRHAIAQDVTAGADATPGDGRAEDEPALHDRASAPAALGGFVAVSQDDSLVEGLEDELNALLGSSGIDRPAPVSPIADVQTAPVSVEARAVSPEDRVAISGPDMRSVDVSDDMFDDAFRDESWLDSRYPETGLDASPPDDFDLDLDDHEFDAALSDAIADDLGNVPRPEPTDANAASTIKEPESMSRDGNDPYAALAALSANLKNAPSWPGAAVDRGETQHVASAPPRAAYGRYDAPDIETVDVPEHAVALADDLDLPEFAFEEEAKNPVLDNLDAEFADLLNDMKTHEPEVRPAAVAAPRHDDRRAVYDDAEDPDMRAAAASFAADELRPSRSFDDDDYEASFSARSTASGLDPDYDPDFEDDVIPSAYAASAERPPQRRGLLVAAVVGGVALIAAAGAFALSSGGDGGSEIALVKADPSPVKVKPENPGGVAIANQDNKVYDTVGRGMQTVAPRQEKLLSSAEEPVDIPVEEEGDMADGADGTMPGLMQDDAADAADATPAATGTTARVAAAPATPKDEDRVEQAEADNAGVDDTVEVSAVAPRKVRTMIVKADGTLVAREETEEPAARQQAASASESMVDGGTPDAAPATEAVEEAPAAATDAGSQASAAKPSQTPKSIPVAPSRPADQPVDIVGVTKPEQVASLAPAATGGAWAMQIASQPSEAAAKSSYQDLVRRYGTVLEGHQASIVKAEIAGKGTFWRVRVPAGGRGDAIQLCERYKAAGGSCFVSK